MRFIIFFWGGSGRGRGGHGKCEQRTEVFVKNKKKNYLGGSGWGGGGGGQDGCERRIDVFVKIGDGGVGSWGGVSG